MFCVVENERRKHLAWLAFVLKTKGWRIAELSRRTGMNPSAFSHFKNDPQNKAQLDPSTIAAISEASGIPPLQLIEPVAVRGLAEQESAPYEAVPLESIDGAVKALKAGRNGIDPWVLKSRSLENAGYLPGDVVMVDLNARPEQGDIVCAQVYDRLGRAETIFRIYEHPFLIAATLDRNLFKPHLIDNDRVIVRGVVIATFRERKAAA
jgi:transcriptional regulator with XRE-family HTH domain